MGRLGRLLLIYFIIMSLAACQKKKVETANPFFEEWTTPYGVPPFDRIRPEHFLPAFERGMSLHNAEIDAIVGTSDEPTFENTIAAYDASGRMLQRTSLIFEMLAASDATPEMQAVEQEAMPLLAAHADEIRMNEQPVRADQGCLRPARGAAAHGRAAAVDGEALPPVRPVGRPAGRGGQAPAQRDQRRLVAAVGEVRQQPAPRERCIRVG